MRSRKPQKSHRFLSKNKLKWSIVKNPENHGPTAIIQEILREKLCGHGMPWMKTMDFPLISISDVTRHTIPRAAL